MSWQRIMEVARKQGMPVIVTDVAGREPMVILPLEGYERLLGGFPIVKEEKPLYEAKNTREEAHSVSTKPVPGGMNATPTSPVPPASNLQPPASNPDSLRRRQRDGDRVEMLHHSLDTVSQVVGEGASASGQIGSDLLLEERFSFQP